MMKSMRDHKGFSLILLVKRKHSGSSGWIVWVNVWLRDWYCRQVFSFYNRIMSEQSGMHMTKWCKRIFANTLANLARRTLNCVHWEEGATGKSWGGGTAYWKRLIPSFWKKHGWRTISSACAQTHKAWETKKQNKRSVQLWSLWDNREMVG